MSIGTSEAFQRLLKERGSITLRVGVDEASGMVYLYDKESDRIVRFHRHLSVSLDDPLHDVQVVTIEIITDPFVNDDE